MIRRFSKARFQTICVRQLIAVLSVLALLSSLSAAWAQQTKRPLTHGDYDSWRTIQGPQISRDGKFVAYAYMPEDGDGEIVVRNLTSGAEWRAQRGYRPPTTPPEDANVAEFLAAQARLVRPVITADSRLVLFSIDPTKEEVKKAKREKKKPEEMPKNALGIMDLTSGQVTKIDRVKNFQVPEDVAGFVAYLLEAKPEEKKAETKAEEAKPQLAAVEAQPTSSETTAAASPAPSSKDKKGKDKKKEYGSDLVLRNTVTNSERIFNDVVDYSFSKDARSLVYSVSSRKAETNGVYVAWPQHDSNNAAALISGKGKYQKLTWDEDQTELAFISDHDDAEAQQPKFKIYHWDRRADKAQLTRLFDQLHILPRVELAFADAVPEAAPHH